MVLCALFLVGCSPNGAVCFVSPLFVGSISDVVDPFFWPCRKTAGEIWSITYGRSWFYH